MSKLFYYFSFNLMFFSILLLFQSCGKDSGTDLTQAVGAVQNEEVPVEDQGRYMDLQEALDLKLSPSSAKYNWKKSYSESIVREFSRKELEHLTQDGFQISENDLEVLGCSGFNRANKVEKMKFYLLFLASVAEAESDFKNESYSKAPNGTSNIGIFQIDEKAGINNTNVALGKKIYNPKSLSDFMFFNSELKNGDFNSKTSTYIFKNQLKKHRNQLFTKNGNFFYWEVLGCKSLDGVSCFNGSINKNFIAYFNKHVNQLNFCE